MAQAVARKRSCKNLLELAGAMCQAALEYQTRSPHFHAVEAAWWLSLLPLGFTFRQDEVPNRTGQKQGLHIVRQQQSDANLSDLDLARECDISSMEAHTALCAYSKYVRWYHWSITRWYLAPPKCFREEQ